MSPSRRPLAAAVSCPPPADSTCDQHPPCGTAQADGCGAAQTRLGWEHSRAERDLQARFAAVAKKLGCRSNSHLQSLHPRVRSVCSVSPGMSTALWCKQAEVVSTEL